MIEGQNNAPAPTKNGLSFDPVRAATTHATQGATPQDGRDGTTDTSNAINRIVERGMDR